jgi:hypothetical protein
MRFLNPAKDSDQQGNFGDSLCKDYWWYMSSCNSLVIPFVIFRIPQKYNKPIRWKCVMTNIIIKFNLIHITICSSEHLRGVTKYFTV